MRRGDCVAYIHSKKTKLLVISDPYDYGGAMVVTARTCHKSKSRRETGIYAVRALIP